MRHIGSYLKATLAKVTCASVGSLAIAVLLTAPAAAHELWIETTPTAQPGSAHAIEICWGHSGERTSGPAMADKLSADIKAPDGSVTRLPLALHDDCYQGKPTLTAPGFHAIGAVLQTGIIDQEVHGIPAKTRIVMTAQARVQVGQSDAGLANTLGSDLEITLLTNPKDLRPGSTVAAKILFRGKPLGGRNALVSLGTAGPNPPADDSRVDERQWAIEAHADPRTGEVRLPLIAAAQHVFLMRYLDETPGTYKGDLDFGSRFSHLHKGDTYERTMYVATFAFDVKND